MLHPVRQDGRGTRNRNSDQTRIDRIAAGLMGAAEKSVGRTADTQSFCSRGEHHRLRIGEPGRQRLLQIDVLACLDDLQVHRRMGGRHGQVHDDLDVRISEQCIDGHRITEYSLAFAAAASARMSATDFTRTSCDRAAPRR